MGLAMAAFRGRFRRPPAPAQLALLLWFGWVITYGVVYSYAGGIMHLYYLATMAPPLAALAAIGVVSLWDRYLQRGWGAVLLPTTLLLTAVWQFYIQASALGWKLGETANPTAAITALRTGYGDWQTWLHVVLLAGTLVAAGSLLVLCLRRAWGRPGPALAAGALSMRIARPCARRFGPRMGEPEGEMESPPPSDWNLDAARKATSLSGAKPRM
jgi:4-amino-4-deoxy-L-arabinose transferase-like glycosyltransferase